MTTAPFSVLRYLSLRNTYSGSVKVILSLKSNAFPAFDPYHWVALGYSGVVKGKWIIAFGQGTSGAGKAGLKHSSSFKPASSFSYS